MSKLLSLVKRFKVQHTILFPLLVVLLVSAVVGSTVFAATRNLNKTIPGTINITTPLPQSSITLYTDNYGAIMLPSNYSLDFGTVPQGIPSATITLWFRAEEIDPASVRVTDNMKDYDIIYTVGIPDTTRIGKPCPLVLSIPTTLPVGRQPFTVTITGSGG